MMKINVFDLLILTLSTSGYELNNHPFRGGYCTSVEIMILYPFGIKMSKKQFRCHRVSVLKLLTS